MTTMEEYMKLYISQDPELMSKVGMDSDQRKSAKNSCVWTAAVLERIGDEIENNQLIINKENKNALARIMRSSMNDCRKYIGY